MLSIDSLEGDSNRPREVPVVGAFRDYKNLTVSDRERPLWFAGTVAALLFLALVSYLANRDAALERQLRREHADACHSRGVEISIADGNVVYSCPPRSN